MVSSPVKAAAQSGEMRWGHGEWRVSEFPWGVQPDALFFPSALLQNAGASMKAPSPSLILDPSPRASLGSLGVCGAVRQVRQPSQCELTRMGRRLSVPDTHSLWRTQDIVVEPSFQRGCGEKRPPPVQLLTPSPLEQG